MAGIWVRAGTVTLTNGSKKVTGSGTAWNTGTNKVTKGCAFIYNNIEYEVDYINSDTELYLVDTYNGTTASGLSYRIQIAVTDTIPELAARIATALAYWNSQAGNLQSLVLSSGNVTLTAPDGTQVVVPSYSNMQPKDALLTALAALTTAADKLPYFTGVDTVAQTTLTAFARTLLDDIDAATARTTLGAQASDATLTALAAVVTAADKLIYATGADTFATATLTAFARSILSSNDAATMLSILGVDIEPTVNPSLDLDFSKQKYKVYSGAAGLTESSDMTSLVTLTRSTVARYFDALGVMQAASVNQPRIGYDPSTGECKGLLIEEAKTNYMSYSDQLITSAWTKNGVYATPSDIKAKDNSLRLCRISDNVSASAVHQIYRGASVTTGNTYTFSAIVKAGSKSLVGLFTNGRLQTTIAFDLLNKTTTKISTDAVISWGMDELGDGFFRCYMTFVQGSNTSAGIVLLNATNTYFYASDGTGYIYAGNLQMEDGTYGTSYIPSTDTWTARASVATYIDSNGVMQTASSGVARTDACDYDSDGILRPIGLLLEAAATNLFTYSNDFSNAIWTKFNASISANSQTDPFGTTTADKLVESTANDVHHAYQSIAASASTLYTASVYVKAAERTYAYVSATDGATAVSALVNLTDGGTSSVTSGYDVRVRKAPNGFWRVSISMTTGASATTMKLYVYVSNGGTSAYIGDGASGIAVFGAQIGAGSYSSSYIDTTSAQVTRVADSSSSVVGTRAADVVSISSANTAKFLKQYEGTLYADIYNPTTTTTDSSALSRGVAVVSDSTANNSISFGVEGGVSAAVTKGGAAQSSQTVGAATVGAHQIGLSYVANSIKFAVDGVFSAEDTTAAIPYMTQINIGKGAIAGGALNGHIRKLRYYPKALSSSELQALTA